MEQEYIYHDIGVGEAVEKVMNSLPSDTRIESIEASSVNGETRVKIKLS